MGTFLTFLVVGGYMFGEKYLLTMEKMSQENRSILQFSLVQPWIALSTFALITYSNPEGRSHFEKEIR